MGKRKWMGIYIAALVALLAGPSLSSAAGPERINESFVMGDTGCQMNIELDGDTGGIVSAELGPAFEPPASPPPPTVYSFNFTGAVDLIMSGDPPWPPPPGTPPNGIVIGTPFSGTFTFAPSTFQAVGNQLPDIETYSYVPGNTVASISVTFGSVGSTNLSLVSNNDIINYPGPTYAIVKYHFPGDSFILFSRIMDSTPALTIDSTPATDITVDAGIFFEDYNSPYPLSSTAIPTVLNLGNWDWPYLRISASDRSFDFLGTLTSLAPASVPSPPGDIIINSVASPTLQQIATVPEWCAGTLPPPENISDTLVCKDCTGPDGDGIYTCAPANCEPKTAVERNVMEKSGDGSTYCYYDKLGRRVCKTI